VALILAALLIGNGCAGVVMGSKPSGSGATPVVGTPPPANTPQPQLSATPMSAIFPMVTAGASNSQTVTLQNTGSASVTISAANVVGAGFATSGLTIPLNLAVGQSATFNAVFAPTSAGSVAGSISLLSNAPGSPLVISASGTASAATPILSSNTNSLGFGSVLVGSTAALGVTLRNAGNVNVIFSSIVVGGTGFKVSGAGAGTTLTSGQSVPLNVTFAPSAAGPAAGSIDIGSNAGTVSIALAGSGTLVAGGNHIYLAQAAAGLANGSSCADALDASFFNASANWGTATGQIGSAATVHLCGVIPISLSTPTSQGTGLITIKFEPNAKMQQPAATNFIDLSNSTNSWLITGQAPCGFQAQNPIPIPCPEKIQNTDNGSPAGGFGHQVFHINAIAIGGSTGSVTVQNLEIGPLYMHTDPADFSFSNGAILANAIVDDPMIGSLTFQDSICHDTSWCLSPTPRQGAPNPVFTVARMEFYDNDHDIALGSTCSPACYSVDIGWIHSHNHENWNTTSNAYHHDGIHTFNSQLQATSVRIHNSLFDGVWNGNGTDPIFDQVNLQNLSLYNNIFICTPAECTQDPNAGLIAYGGGPNYFAVNNTIIQTGIQRTGSGSTWTNNVGIDLTLGSGRTTGNVTFQNNLITGGAGLLTINGPLFAPGGLDYNLYANGIANGSGLWAFNGKSTNSFSADWLGSGEGTHSQYVADPLLIPDGTPLPGSPAIGAGTNLTAACGRLPELCFDYFGNARPATGPWTVGARQ